MTRSHVTRLPLTGGATGSQWLQATRFAAVGASGYAVNLCVFVLAMPVVGHYSIAAALSFICAATSNYTLNRVWTFRSKGKVSVQASRFLVVSVVALCANEIVLSSLVGAGAPALEAQASAILLLAPVSFVANKRWAFRP